LIDFYVARPGGSIFMRSKAILLCAFAVFLASIPCFGQAVQAPASPAAVPVRAPASLEEARFLKSTEAFVRLLFGWGPEVKVTLGPLAPSIAPGFYVVPIQVTLNEQNETGEVYVSKDGKTLLRGDIFDMSADPYAANRAKIHIDGNPTKGPVDAPVTLVEFADFQCPHCRELWEALQTVEAKYPQLRVVFKDFPLNTIHPWAETAALGARCAYEQSADAFWKVHDSIFENQDVISAENVWDKLLEYATQAGLNADTFKGCMASPDAQKAVDANHADGVTLGVSSTPTVYINGRQMVGGDVATLSQYIDFDLAQAKK
jgi:protein-disulfide isomerase